MKATIIKESQNARNMEPQKERVNTVRADQESGRIPSSIYRYDDGAIYWECAE